MTRPRSDEGASATVVALVLPLLLGMVMLTADAGALWGKRSDMVTATDASALAAAAAFAKGQEGCATAGSVLTPNSAGAELELCAPVNAAGHGFVLVQAQSEPVPVRFGGLFGIGPKKVRSASVARWGALETARRLRPIGICAEHPYVQQWLGLGSVAGTIPTSAVRRIEFTKDSPNVCGANAPGNWGWLDLDGARNANSELRTWVAAGYPGAVGINDCDGDGVPGDGCDGDTGSSGGSVETALQDLVTDRTEFGIVIYDRVEGNGANARFRVFGFLGVVLHGFRVTGAEKTRYFDFEFRELVLDGKCCSTEAIWTGVTGVKLCAAEEPLDAATRCLD